MARFLWTITFSPYGGCRTFETEQPEIAADEDLFAFRDVLGRLHMFNWAHVQSVSIEPIQEQASGTAQG